MRVELPPRMPNYWFFFVPFSICALLGFAGIIAGDILMPDNAGGAIGRLAIYRNLAPVTMIWAIIAIWSWHKIRLSRCQSAD